MWFLKESLIFISASLVLTPHPHPFPNKLFSHALSLKFDINLKYVQEAICELRPMA